MELSASARPFCGKADETAGRSRGGGEGAEKSAPAIVPKIGEGPPHPPESLLARSMSQRQVGHRPRRLPPETSTASFEPSPLEGPRAPPGGSSDTSGVGDRLGHRIRRLQHLVEQGQARLFLAPLAGGTARARSPRRARSSPSCAFRDVAQRLDARARLRRHVARVGRERALDARRGTRVADRAHGTGRIQLAPAGRTGHRSTPLPCACGAPARLATSASQRTASAPPRSAKAITAPARRGRPASTAGRLGPRPGSRLCAPGSWRRFGGSWSLSGMRSHAI